MTKVGWFVGVTAALLCASACGGSSDGGSSGSGGGGGSGGSGGNTFGNVPESEFASRVVDTVCGNLAACCRAEGLPTNEQQCRSAYNALIAEGVPKPGALPYDANIAGQCLTALDAATKSCGSLFEADAAVCERVWKGDRQAGETCTSDIECAVPEGGRASCYSSDGGPDVCNVERRGKAGDACDSTCTEEPGSTSCFGGGSSGGTPANTSCYTNDGLVCNDGTCGPIPGIGEPCDFGGCGEDAFCDFSDGCQPKVAVGQPCSGFDECVDAAYCADGTCTAKKADGQPCEDFDECVNECLESGTCGDESGIDEAICAGDLFGGDDSAGSGSGSGGGSAGN